jgi:hypothetical protein
LITRTASISVRPTAPRAPPHSSLIGISTMSIGFIRLVGGNAIRLRVAIETSADR